MENIQYPLTHLNKPVWINEHQSWFMVWYSGNTYLLDQRKYLDPQITTNGHNTVLSVQSEDQRQDLWITCPQNLCYSPQSRKRVVQFIDFCKMSNRCWYLRYVVAIYLQNSLVSSKGNCGWPRAIANRKSLDSVLSAIVGGHKQTKHKGRSNFRFTFKIKTESIRYFASRFLRTGQINQTESSCHFIGE